MITSTLLDSLPLWQILLVGLCFVWSGFVRSELGHYLALNAQQRIAGGDKKVFEPFIGIRFIAVSIFGLLNLLQLN